MKKIILILLVVLGFILTFLNLEFMGLETGMEDRIESGFKRAMPLPGIAQNRNNPKQ